MRILIATTARGPVGGVETYLRGITPSLLAAGHAIAMLFEHRYESAHSDLAPELDPYAGCAAEWHLEEIGEPAALAAARHWRPDIVWMHGVESGGLEAGLLSLAPALLYAHNHDGLCATGRKLHLWPGPRPCTRILGVGCIPLNFLRQCGLPNPAGFAASWRRQTQRAGQMRRYRRILVASRYMQGEIAALLRAQGADPGTVRSVGYPVLEPRGPAPLAADRLPSRLLVLARLVPGKGVDLLLSAMVTAEASLGRRLPLVIGGDGPERARLERRARQLGLDARFAGWLDRGERQRQLAEADLLVIPSVWPEPFGMVGLEAACRGVPAVGFPVGGILDWLTSGLNGEIAPGPVPTAPGLASALVAALEAREHWNDLRRGAWHMVERFGLDPHLMAIQQAFAATRNPEVPSHG